jgi:ABC-type dipeptide/oligopeptide/nickel transport system ATPase component
LETGIEDIDTSLGGIPLGLLVIYGEPGTGKSQLCKSVTKALAAKGKKIIHFYGDDSIDAPTTDPKQPNYNTVDMVSYKFNPENTTKAILKYCQQLQPDLIILDSLTTIFGATTKAVPEADVREWTLKLAQHIAGKCACIATSEVRGRGYGQQPAGGMGVLFPAVMVLYTSKKLINANWDENRYHQAQGSYVWLLTVEKDREGVAAQGKEFIVQYMDDQGPFLT